MARPWIRVIITTGMLMLAGIPATTAGPAATSAPPPAAELAALAAWLERSYEGVRPPESVRMLLAIARGSQMGPGEGWFGPSSSRYGWEWLAQLHAIDANGELPRDRFKGQAAWFDRLDRDHDGRIVKADLDWSESSSFVRDSYTANRIFRRLDTGGDGRLTRDELTAFVERALKGKDSLVSEDLRDALLAPPSASFRKGDAPTPELLVRGLFLGEIGSMNEGPRVGDPAPDFRLKTQDGSSTVRLSDLMGARPVVLIFGNFTCGPFRSMFPSVDEVSRRHRDEATFLTIYVREAHPADGWRMASNTDMGVELAQPRSYEERLKVARGCHAQLKPSMPLLVDEINDPAGHAYSGMPARLYVIAPDGKVAYKSGRDPFGFRPEEMEQALVMCLLDRKGPPR